MTTSESTHVIPVEIGTHDLAGIEPGQPYSTITGALLGQATSRRDHHNHDGAWPAPDRRCSACRWFSVAIYRIEAGYLVYTAGWSRLPGETTLPKVEVTASAFDVVELMTVRNSREGTIIPRPNARALAQAAGHDAAIQDAYVNRATV